MADDDNKAAGGRSPSGRSTSRANERPFDMWLQKQLHAMYDEIASEPLPDDLLNLIDSDAAQGKQNGKQKDASDEPREKK